MREVTYVHSRSNGIRHHPSYKVNLKQQPSLRSINLIEKHYDEEVLDDEEQDGEDCPKCPPQVLLLRWRPC